MRAILLHNPAAGPGAHAKDEILLALRHAGIRAHYVSTCSSAAEAALQRDDVDLVVVAGGDGTVGRTLTALRDRSLPVGILPLGSANNIARSLGIAGRPQDLAGRWQLERTRRFDIGSVDGNRTRSLFLEGFGVGLLPAYLRAIAAKPKAKGEDNLRIGREVLRQVLKEAKPIDISVTADGRPVDGDLLGIEVLNTPYTGPGLPLAATADCSDGLLDIVCFEAHRRAALLDWIETPQGNRPPVKSLRAARFTLQWQSALSRIDDAVVEHDAGRFPLEIVCEGQAARVLMPASPAGLEPGET